MKFVKRGSLYRAALPEDVGHGILGLLSRGPQPLRVERRYQVFYSLLRRRRRIRRPELLLLLLLKVVKLLLSLDVLLMVSLLPEYTCTSGIFSDSR